MTSAGDLAALLGGAAVERASATIRDWLDPHATLAAWSTGPWAAEAAGGDPGVFGMPEEPYTDESRQWLETLRGDTGVVQAWLETNTRVVGGGLGVDRQGKCD